MSDAERIVLGIESSCDETAAAVLRAHADHHRLGGVVLSNVIASQHALHQRYKGVVPEIASRAHCENLLPVIRDALSAADVSYADIRAVAVGNRPGLIGALLVGVAAAKALAWSLGVPVIGVDHVHAHLIAGLIGPPDDLPSPCVFPALGLVVSGGHTSLYLCNDITQPRRIGTTIDDAVGEAYDKVATILGLDHPGGPRLDRLAQTAQALLPGFPIARIAPQSLDFSFSGLKTAALYAYRGVPEDDRTRAKRESRGEPRHPTHDAPTVAATFQHAAVASILLKLERALDQHSNCRTLLVGGGVSANSLLRTRLTELATRRSLDLRLPRLEYCLDNAAMIAALGSQFLHARNWRSDELNMTATPTTAI